MHFDCIRNGLCLLVNLEEKLLCFSNRGVHVLVHKTIRPFSGKIVFNEDFQGISIDLILFNLFYFEKSVEV